MATKNSGKSQSSRGGGGSRGENKGGQSKSQAKSDPRPGDRQREKSRGQSPKNGGARGQTGSQQKSKPQRDQNESRPGSGAKGGANKKGGGGGGVIGSIKQHPLTTAAIGAGFGLLALEGVRRAMQASRQSTSRGKGKRRHGGDDDEDDARRQRDDEDEDAPEAEDQADDAEDADEEDDEDAGEEDDEDDDASAGGQAGDSDDEDDEDDEGAGGSSLGQFARNSLSRIGSAMRGGTSNLSRAAGRGYDRGRDIGGGGWQSNPLVICAASLAAGAALGFLLPSTKQEDRLMGKPSDRIAGRLKNVSSKVVDQGRKAFSDAADATAKEAEREGLTPSQLGKKVKKIAAHIRDAIADAVE